MRAAAALWALCFVGVLVFRGSQAANILLLVVSLGLIAIGIVAMRRK
jgi:hypothetical protein